jgi:zinc transporter 1/2/3
MAVFCVDLGAEVYVERKFGVSPQDGSATNSAFLRSEKPNSTTPEPESTQQPGKYTADRLSFAQQIGAFLVLEFGIMFHSVIIGFNLGLRTTKLRVRHKLTSYTRLRS